MISSWHSTSSKLRKTAFFIKIKQFKYIYYNYDDFTCRDDEVIAAASLNYDPAVSVVAQRLVAGKVITRKEAEWVKSVFMLLSSEWQIWTNTLHKCCTIFSGPLPVTKEFETTEVAELMIYSVD